MKLGHVATHDVMHLARHVLTTPDGVPHYAAACGHRRAALVEVQEVPTTPTWPHACWRCQDKARLYPSRFLTAREVSRVQR